MRVVTLATTRTLNTLNEAIESNGAPIDVYSPLLTAAHRLGRDGMAERWATAKRSAALESFTFCPSANTTTTVPTDWFPRLIPMPHWERIAAGVSQRLRALNRFLGEVYCGQQSIVPEDIVRSGRYYRPELTDTAPPRDVFVHIYGIDLVHLGDGEYAVLEDNLRVPSGIAYQMKTLQIGAECVPEFRSEYSVLPYDIVPAYQRLFASLTDVEEPNTVLLTDGKWGSAFFEHRYLSDLLGIPLVEGYDLYVDDHYQVWCRTLDGAFPVHVVYRRVEDLDMFVPGLTAAYRKGKVAIVNAPGAGAADDKLVFLWVPDMINAYLDEEPILRQARSWDPESPQDRDYIFEHVDSMVLKTRDGYGGMGVYIMPDLAPPQRTAARKALRAQPEAFIAQEMLEFSRHLVFDEAERDFDERYIDLRVYAVQDGDGNVTVFPGGLTRVAKDGTRITNNSSGGACKETWVVC
jgi:uncharacterized circularly permuted ATP-grasp superfamily protein